MDSFAVCATFRPQVLHRPCDFVLIIGPNFPRTRRRKSAYCCRKTRARQCGTAEWLSCTRRRRARQVAAS
jgi:hypothetical protein